MGLARAAKFAAIGAGAFLAGRAVLRRLNPYDFRNKVVIVTGGSRGLGLVIARQLALRGARLMITARDREDLRRAESDLRTRGADVLAVACDSTSRDDVENAVAQAIGHWGRVDVLINNAGIIQVGPAEVMTERDYEQAMQTHFWGPLYAVEAVLPHMQARGTGRIVNISSIGGRVSVPHLLPYCASKFALTGYSEGLHAELAKDGITVTTVTPGLMRTGSPRNALFKSQHRAEYTMFAISDSLPLLTTDAETAARKIINACARGDADLVLTVPAKLAVALHGLFPGLTAEVMGCVNRVLPGPGGIGQRSVRGYESETPLAPSWITALTERAARRNNEMA